MSALFLRHEGFLGAVGAFLKVHPMHVPTSSSAAAMAAAVAAAAGADSGGGAAAAAAARPVQASDRNASTKVCVGRYCCSGFDWLHFVNVCFQHVWY
jgi:hypothetical protein